MQQPCSVISTCKVHWSIQYTKDSFYFNIYCTSLALFLRIYFTVTFCAVFKHNDWSFCSEKITWPSIENWSVQTCLATSKEKNAEKLKWVAIGTWSVFVFKIQVTWSRKGGQRQGIRCNVHEFYRVISTAYVPLSLWLSTQLSYLVSNIFII